jgi:hypothetical protein
MVCSVSSTNVNLVDSGIGVVSMIEMSCLKIAIIFVLELICRDQEESRWEVIKIMEGWEEGKDEGIDCFGVVGFVSNHINYIHRLMIRTVFTIANNLAK